MMTSHGWVRFGKRATDCRASGRETDGPVQHTQICGGSWEPQDPEMEESSNDSFPDTLQGFLLEVRPVSVGGEWVLNRLCDLCPSVLKWPHHH